MNIFNVVGTLKFGDWCVIRTPRSSPCWLIINVRVTDNSKIGSIRAVELVGEGTDGVDGFGTIAIEANIVKLILDALDV